MSRRAALIRALGICTFSLHEQALILYREMMRGIPERDWKYLRSVKGELLEALCERINNGAQRLVAAQASGEHEKFLRLYSYLIKENEVVADCFDDWRRSNIMDKLLALRRHGLLTDEYLSRLSAETQDRINR